MIGRIYPTSPQVHNKDGSDEQQISDERQAKDAMLRIVAERGKYFYNYSEYWFAGILRFFCSCCCSRRPWYKRQMEKLARHETASEKLAEEIDIIKFIYVLRVGQFLSKLILNKS